MENFDAYRSQFPITQNYTFLNHAAVSAPSVRVVQAIESVTREFSHEGIAYEPKWMRRVEQVRALLGRMIHAEPGELAFVGNTSEGLSAVASGLRWKKGDGVLAPLSEFPTNVYPWVNLERLGVKVHFFQKPEGRFGVTDVEKALRPGTRLLTVSSVDFATGFRCDLDALGGFCREKGLLFSVDAIQSLGVIPMDVKKSGIHFLASGSHKWLLSTMGCGALFISSDVDHLLDPERVGWKSVAQEDEFFQLNFNLKPDALRFEPGTMNVAGVYALGAALELLMEVGVEKIYEHILDLNHLIYQGLQDRRIRIISPMGARERSGILSFVPPTNPKTLYKFLIERKIMVALRGELIRLSPHFYNSEEDVRQFFQAFDRF